MHTLSLGCIVVVLLTLFPPFAVNVTVSAFQYNAIAWYSVNGPTMTPLSKESPLHSDFGYAPHPPVCQNLANDAKCEAVLTIIPGLSDR